MQPCPQKIQKPFTLSTDMGVKIGNNTLLAGDTVLESGERVNVSRTNAGDTKAPLSMAVTSEESSPAYDPAWLSDPNGIVNVAMVDAMMDAAGGGSAFDDVFEVGYDGGADINISAKNTDKPIVLTAGSGWHILSNGRIYICSYNNDFDVCGNNVNIGTNDYPVLQATSGGSVTISARTSLNFVDASGSFALGDLARVGDVYFSETDSNNLQTWNAKTLPAGWYSVDVLLFAPVAVSVGNLLLSATRSSGRIKSAQGMAFGGSGSTYCYFVTSSSWSGGGGGTISCNIMRLSFAYKHVPANGVDWMVLSDLNKFYGGSVRYKAINTPKNI